jgi:hypothetical protein
MVGSSDCSSLVGACTQWRELDNRAVCYVPSTAGSVPAVQGSRHCSTGPSAGSWHVHGHAAVRARYAVQQPGEILTRPDELDIAQCCCMHAHTKGKVMNTFRPATQEASMHELPIPRWAPHCL